MNRTPRRRGGPPPNISHNQSSNNELNELQRNTWEVVMKNIYKNKCNIKKRIGIMPPCMLHVIRTKNMDKRMVTMDIIWHARCAGQLALM